MAGLQTGGLFCVHVTYRHSHTGCATRCPQDFFLRETCYSVLPTRWKPAPRHKNQITSRKAGFFYSLDLPNYTLHVVSNKLMTRTSLESLGSLHEPPNNHGVPCIGMETGVMGIHRAGLLSCHRITRIVTFCWKAQLSSCQVTTSRQRMSNSQGISVANGESAQDVTGAEGGPGEICSVNDWHKKTSSGIKFLWLECKKLTINKYSTIGMKITIS